MKKTGKIFLSLLLTLCWLAVPFSGALAEGEALNLMPTADDGYTIVEGDGTVTIEDGTMTIVNNSDGNFRVTIDNTTRFDLSVLNTLHMEFNAEMPFKMAYHLISEADNSNDWLNTSTDYTDLYEIDLEADRAAAGEYNVQMDIGGLAVAITDTSSVYFEQFIILVTGKGTFTLNTVEMITVESEEPAVDEPADEEPADDDVPTTDEPADDDTASTQTEDEGSSDDSAASNQWWPIVVAIVVVIAIVCVVVIIIIKRRKA